MGQQSLYIICFTCTPSSFCRRSVLLRLPFLMRLPLTAVCVCFYAHTACTRDLIAVQPCMPVW